MRPSAVLPAFLVLWTGIFGWTASARAWTDASVRSATARVTLSDDGSTVHVELTAQLRVDGGWLEGFELDGLDDDLVLDPENPPTFEHWARPAVLPSMEGAEPSGQDAELRVSAPVFVASLSPRVTVHGSRIAMSFRRRGAPRAGLYRARVTYDAPAAAFVTRTSEHAEFHWTLPAWRNGLDDVEVVLVLPEGAHAQPLSEDEDASVDVSEASIESADVLTFNRVHLPRTQHWTVRAELPESFRLPAVSTTAPEATFTASSAPRSSVVPALFSFLLALLVIAKSSTAARDAAVAMASPGALLAMPLPVRMALVLLALVGAWASLLWAAGWVGDLFPFALAAMAALGAHGAGRPLPDARRLGSFRSGWGSTSVRAREAHRRARWRWHHATSVPGALLLGVTLLTLWGCLRAELLTSAETVVLAASALLLFGGRRNGGTPHEQLGELLAFAQTLSVNLDARLALAPLIHVDIRGRVQAARLRVVLADPADGLLRSDLVLCERGPQFLAVARRGSTCERALVAFAAEHRVPVQACGEDRTALLWDVRKLDIVCSALTRTAAGESTLRCAS